MEIVPYVLLTQKQQEEMGMEVYLNHRGLWEFRYRDHHTVKQERCFKTLEEAKFAVFKWKLVRGMFIADVYGGCHWEIAEAYGTEVMYHPERPTQEHEKEAGQ